METKKSVESILKKTGKEIFSSYFENEHINDIDSVNLPITAEVLAIIDKILNLLFPRFFKRECLQKKNLEVWSLRVLREIFCELKPQILRSLIYGKPEKCDDNCEEVAGELAAEIISALPEIRRKLTEDAHSIYIHDPAANGVEEIILSYPGFIAITYHRIAHEFYRRSIPFLPRIIAEYAHSKTGCDIHPGAKIGRRFFIDHATGIVIGETCKICDDVRIYQHVTLGALSFSKDENGDLVRNQKRHPTIEENVVLYAGSTILGGETVIGKNSVIGGNVWITQSIDSNTIIIFDVNTQKYQIQKKSLAKTNRFRPNKKIF